MAAGALALVVALLAFGPLPLPFIVAAVEKGFAGLSPAAEAEIGDVGLVWDAGARQPVLLAERVRIGGSNAADGMRFERLALSVSPSALLRGDVIPRRLFIDSLGLRVVRGPMGRWQVALMESDQPAVEPDADGRGDLARLFAIHRELGLDSIELRDSVLFLDDQRRQLRGRVDVDRFVARQDEAGWQAHLVAVAAPSLGGMRLDARGDLDEDAGALTVSADMSGLEIAVLTDLVAGMGDAQPVHGRLGGRLELELDADGVKGPVRLFAHSEEVLNVFLPGHDKPAPVQSFAAEAHLSPRGNWVDLRHVALSLTGTELVGSATLTRQEEGWTARGGIQIDTLEAEALKQRWPAGAAEGGRRWVTENVLAGTIRDFEMEFDLTTDDLAADWMPAEAVQGKGRVEGAVIRYLPLMEPLRETSADAFFDARSLTFIVDGGTDGYATIDVGEVRLTDLGKPDAIEQLAVSVSASATLDDVFRQLAQPPVRLVEKSNIEADEIEGGVVFNLEIALPLLNDLPAERVDLNLTGRATDVAVSSPRLPQSVTNGNFDVFVTIDEVRLDGTGEVAGVPLELTYDRAPDAGIDQLTARGRVSMAQMASLGAPARLPMRGSPLVTAILPMSGGPASIEASLDQVEVEVPAAGLWKPADLPGTMKVTAEPDSAGRLSFALEIAWTGVDIRGAVDLDTANQLRAARFDKVVIAGTDIALEVTRDGDRFTASVRGARLDLGPYVNFAAERSGGGQPATVNATLDVDVGTIVLTPDSDGLRNVSGSLHVVGGLLDEADLRGRVGPSARFTASLSPAGGGQQRLTVRSDDAGAFLGALGITKFLQGGALSIDAQIASLDPVVQGQGTLLLSNVTFHDAPAAVQLISRMPKELEGAAEPGDLYMDQIELDFALDGSIASLKDLRAAGSDIAIRAEGAYNLRSRVFDVRGNLAPLAGVNNFIGNIPLIGQLLRGSTGAGAFVVTFEIMGPRDNPQVTVNPLSVVAPGALRDLFGGKPSAPSEIELRVPD